MKRMLDRLRGKVPPVISEPLWAAVTHAIPFLDMLDAADSRRLKKLTETFLAHKEFSACGGLVLTDEMCVAIAAQACLPILELGLAAYADWVGIVVYPDVFVVPRQIEDDSGVVHEYDDILSGEAWPGGPVIISWRDVQMAGDGYNVVIHEFAHKLDLLNGDADGIPALHTDLDLKTWSAGIYAAYDDFCDRVDHEHETGIDPYASESPGEFFAVLSECFFETPDIVATEYPGVYALLTRYYRQDPLLRQGRAHPR